MNKTVLALLALGLAALLGVVLWFALESPARQGPAAGQAEPAHADAPAAETLTAPAPLALASTPESTTAERAADGATESTERRVLDGPESGRALVGRVLAPAGAPADDSLRVVALSEALSLNLVYGISGALADLKDEKRDASKVLASSSVEPDGSFRLALPTSGTVWLAVDGRFLYSPAVQSAAAEASSVELSVALGACVAGRVRLPAGTEEPAKALEELGVELGADATQFSMSAAEVTPLFKRRAEPDGDGRFELRALPAGHPLSLEVETDAFAHWRQEGLELEPGVVRSLEIELLRGATLRGVVRDDQGQPIAGAEVKAAASGMFGFPGKELAEAESDGAGAFTLEHVAPGKALLVAEHEGYLESEPEKLELRDGEQREGFVLTLGSGASISGRVISLADGSPAADAKIEVDFDPAAMMGMGALNAARGAKGKATSADDGRFQVGGLGKGPFVVKATLERGSGDDKERWSAKAAGVKADTRGLELVLEAPCNVSGKVVDLAGAPVTEFRVRVSLHAAGTVFYAAVESREEPFKDPAGQFALRGLEAGAWKIEASAEGFGPAAPLDLVLPQLVPEPVVLTLAPAASVAGTVLDPAGAPVSGAKVTLHGDMTQRIQRLQGADKQPETLSKEDGTFVLGGLGAGASSLAAAHEGFASSEPVAVDVAAGERAEGVVLRLRKGAVVTGEVYAGDGRPAAGVQIIAQTASNFEMSMKRADGEGKFRIENLSPGSWTITAILSESDVKVDGKADDASAAFLENMRFTMVQLEDGEEEHVVLGAPPKDPVLVRGQVKHGTTPVTSGIVSFFGEGTDGLAGLKMASVGEEGRYEVKLNAPGKYMVTVQINGSGGAFSQQNIEFRRTIPDGEEYRLDLELPLGGVRGSVRGPDKKPLAGARVTLVSDGGVDLGSLLGGQYSESTSDESGHYAFDYLNPGTYTVAAGGALGGGAFGTPSSAGRLIKNGLHVEEGRVLEGVDFQLEESCDIAGKVTDGAGSAVEGAAIFVRDSGGRLLDRFSMIASGSDGSFQYTGVAPGEYQVSARGKGLASQDSAPVRVRPGEKASVELALYAATTLKVEVLGEDGEPAEASITVVDQRGREVQGMLGMAELSANFQGFDSSEQSIGPLPPGSYTVTAVGRDGKKAAKPLNLEGQPERRLKLRLK